MKHEWRKQEAQYYLPKERVEILMVPKFNYMVVKGQGSPDSEEFQERVNALYTAAYSIRMMPKSGYTPEGYYDYTVYPLEGLWTLGGEWDEFEPLDKTQLDYELMIRQPEFVTTEIFAYALEKSRAKADHDVLDSLEMRGIEDGSCVQILHVGSYDDEMRSFDLIKDFLWSNGLMRTSMRHREIYLSDPRKTEKDAIRTVLRVRVTSTTESNR